MNLNTFTLGITQSNLHRKPSRLYFTIGHEQSEGEVGKVAGVKVVLSVRDGPRHCSHRSVTLTGLWATDDSPHKNQSGKTTVCVCFI